MPTPSMKHRSDDDSELTRAKFLGRGLRKNARAGLKTLRNAMGVTQVAIAEASDIAQGEVSRLERREDMMLSTLRRYIEALGGELEVVATFPTGHKVRVDL